MFAILFSDKMDPFYQNIASFPTAVFTVLLVLSVFFWAGAVLGFIDLDFLDFDTDVDLDVADLNADSPHTGPDVLAGLLLRLGLTGVPVTVSLSILILIGWFICYYAVYLINPIVPGRFLEIIVGIPILIGSLYLAALITAQLIKPLRPLFEKATQETHKQLLGQTAVVRTSRVDKDFGEATVDDGGAGLILKVRATGDDTFQRGDRVVLIERIDEASTFRVISEDEFVGQ
ncbi:MAG: DUF1449 domain-containing protein [Pseudomonadota bacterium]